MCDMRLQSLGRNVLYKGTAEITALPPYLTVQMMRFFFKRDTQQKAKILKRVSACMHGHYPHHQPRGSRRHDTMSN